MTRIALRADRIFDGERFLDRGVVLVDGGTIVDTGARGPSGLAGA